MKPRVELDSIGEDENLPHIITKASPTPTATPIARKHLAPISPLRTPKRSEAHPAPEEMHPEHHHISTARPLEENRFLGFLKMGYHTAPSKGSKSIDAVLAATPTKIPNSQRRPPSSPDFQFTFKRQSLELSPEARKMMAEKREEAANIRAQMAAQPIVELPQLESAVGRKIAKPKGKVGRFSDIHMAQFKKMDSIANHPSAFRLDPTRLPSGTPSLKRTQSKAELDKPATAMPKRVLGDAGGSHDSGISGHAKRTKHTQHDDVSKDRPHSRGGVEPGIPSTPQAVKSRSFKSATGQPRRFPRTPTSAARSALPKFRGFRSANKLHSPSVVLSPSAKSVPSPSPQKENPPESSSKIGRLGMKIPVMKSILRTPRRLYSTDPSKLAAGTHIAPPPGTPDVNKELPSIPATMPVKKHVDFSASTGGEDEVSDHGFYSSPIKGSTHRESSSPVKSEISYPSLPVREESPLMPSPHKRAASSNPVDFTFRSNMTVSFGSPTTGTIRHVRKSDFAGSLSEVRSLAGKKRALTDAEESDKENAEDENDRPAKKFKKTEPAPVRGFASKLPRWKEKRIGGLTRARLNLLAMPKRRRE